LFDDSMHAHRHCIYFRLPKWEFHNHFVRFKYMIRGPIAGSVVYFGSSLHFSPYDNSPPYLYFPFIFG
jgi:hypothetical protein